MSGKNEQPELLYPLDARPGLVESLFAALQHLLASFVGIVTPTLIIGGVLDLGREVPYLLSMALGVSGIGALPHQTPKPVLGGATLLMFDTVTGIKILASQSRQTEGITVSASSRFQPADVLWVTGGSGFWTALCGI